MPSKRPASPLSFAEDAYFSSDLPYHSESAAFISRQSQRESQRKKEHHYARSMPSPPCSRTLSHDSMAQSNGSLNETANGPNDAHVYYCATSTNSVSDLPTPYDAGGSQYQYPQARGYFNQNSFTLPNTPLEHPAFSQTPLQQYDMSYMAQASSLAMSGRQNVWDARWNSLFDQPKVQDPQALSPSASQHRQSHQADTGHLAADFDAARRQSTDTGSSSIKSAKSGNNPVSTVLAHHVYSILHGEQAWNVIKQLQRTEIVRDVWSEIATLAHPDKAPEALESPLWEQIVSGKLSLNLHELCSEDLILAVSGLAVLAKRASQISSETGKESGGPDPMRVFIDSHVDSSDAPARQ